MALISSRGRLEFLAAKLIAALVFIIIGMLISVVVGFVTAMIINALSGNSLDLGFFTGGYVWDQFVQFWYTFFIILTFSLMGFMFSVLGRSAMPGIAVGVGILFLEPIITSLMTLAGGWVANIPKYLFAANVNAINALNTLPSGFREFGGGASAQLPSASHAFIVLGIYMIVFLAVALTLFRKRDVTG